MKPMHLYVRPPYQRRAFSLVELIVVVGVLAILVAILIPVVARVRESSNFVICRSNLQQIANVLRVYSNDFHDHYPDSYSLGGAFFRRGPGEKNPADPFSRPEVYGMPSLFSQLRYLPAQSPVWICPSAIDSMKSYKNTYVWGLLTGTSGGMTSGSRGSLARLDTFFVYDNFTNLPYITGFRRGNADPNPTIAPQQYQIPHSSRVKAKAASGIANSRRGAINVLFLNGSVGYVLYETDRNNPNGPPIATPVHGS